MKPENSPKNIERQVSADGQLCFCWTERVSRIFTYRSQLELNANDITLRRNCHGIKRTWKIPVSEIGPSHVTWFFREKIPTVGINYKKKTHIISARLKRHEVEWLAEEMRLFLSNVDSEPSKNVPLKQRRKSNFEKQRLTNQHVRFYITGDFQTFQQICLLVGLACLIVIVPSLFKGEPWREIRPFIFVGATSPIISAALFILKRYIRQVLEITPNKMEFGGEAFGMTVNEPKSLSITVIRLSDIVWYYKNNLLVLGMNRKGSTLEFFPIRLSPDEMPRFMDDVRKTLSTLKEAATSSSMHTEESRDARPSSSLKSENFHSQKRIFLTTTRKEITFSIPLYKRNRGIGFLAMWLTGWTIGGVFAISKLLNRNNEPVSWFLLLWLVGWFFGETAACWEMIKTLFGKEKIIISQERLTLGAFTFGRPQGDPERVGMTFARGEARQYDIAKIQNLSRGDMVEGKLFFEYDGQIVGFCKDVSTEEADSLFSTLKDILNFRCYAVTRIVFGELQIQDSENSSTTLHNPDVSELNFPFVHLQQVFIDAATHDFHQVEQFLTYAVNHIGRDTLKTQADVVLSGNPEQLHPNLYNNLQHIFRTVSES